MIANASEQECDRHTVFSAYFWRRSGWNCHSSPVLWTRHPLSWWSHYTRYHWQQSQHKEQTRCRSQNTAYTITVSDVSVGKLDPTYFKWLSNVKSFFILTRREKTEKGAHLQISRLADKNAILNRNVYSRIPILLQLRSIFGKWGIFFVAVSASAAGKYAIKKKLFTVPQHIPETLQSQSLASWRKPGFSFRIGVRKIIRAVYRRRRLQTCNQDSWEPSPPVSQSLPIYLVESCQPIVEIRVLSQYVRTHRDGSLTLLIQIITGTLSARAIAKCSFDMPISPAFAPTINMTQDGAPDVRP